MSRFRSLASIAVACLAAVTTASAARASDVLDYQQTDPVVATYSYLSSGTWLGNQYPAAHTGPLSSVRLWMTWDPNFPTTDLTIRVYAASGGVPTGSPLASQPLTPDQITSVNAVSGADSLNVAFASPATVVAGQTYAITAETGAPSGAFRWQQASAGLVASSSADSGATWTLNPARLMFATYVDVPGQASAFSLTLDAAGGRCTSQALSGFDTAWVQVPGSAVCSKPGSTLLGWSTSTAFPVAIAQAQVGRRWGAIDDTFDGTRMIFIPVAGYTQLSGDNTLHAIWGPSS